MSNKILETNPSADISAERAAMVEYIKAQLFGPSAVEEILPEPPASRYLLGLLFPKGSVNGLVNEDDIVDDDPCAVGDEVEQDPIALSGQFMPSSVGISFMVSSQSAVTIDVSGAFYRRDEGGFKREPVCDRLSVRPANERSTEVHEVFDGRAELSILWRPLSHGVLATVALVNAALRDGGREQDDSKVIAQVALEVLVDGGGLLRYPSSSSVIADEEEAEQELLYRDIPTFAVGHGCAADWSVSAEGRADCVWAEFLPTHTIPGVSFEVEGSEEVRRLARLAEIDNDRDSVGELLTNFVADYGRWIQDIVSSTSVPVALEEAKQRISARLKSAHLRMAEGVDYLLGDDHDSVVARRAFALANTAMARQMRHSQADAGGSRRPLRHAIDPTQLPPMGREPTWRPFQLAFLLLTIPSTSDGGHPDRDLVDLIWFPTGGGKTEAYLGLVAYEIIRRRMTEQGGGGGTAVITRYTLRLLTTQQFQRAAALTCSLELLRREEDESLGSEPITIGLWVGGGTTPNSIQDAAELLAEMRGGDAHGKSFQVEICPWCGTEVVPENSIVDTDWGVVVTNSDVRFKCPSSLCPFTTGLPIQSVDDCLYSQPPTFLIATTDKFARFAWTDRPSCFFGGAGAPPPSLVIQDELHLISGPLGTVAAIYEAAFDLVARSRGARPKVVASTATIRRAGEQVQSLFDRDVFLFPPSGMSASDSYFVRSDPDSPGRRYVGVMGQSHTPTTGAVHTMATLLQAPVDIGLTGPALDTYWTLVCYHNSLRELGKTVTLARDDVPARAGVIAKSTDNVRSMESDEDLIELTSNVPSSQIPKNLETLMMEHGQHPAVSVVAATNMLSVGVDVPRLGLMMVVGQPKSTSEYVQASSRVGRDLDRPPGLVVTLYSSAKPRDRSHYERFRPYHESIYRSVEPTSVTPWSLPARERALHAALVIIARHALGYGPNDSAGRFFNDPELARILDELTERVSRADAREADAVRSHLDQLVDEWITKIRDGGGQLKYTSSGRQQVGLLRRFTSPVTVAWPTLDSMRNVDHETIVKVAGGS